MSNTFTNRNETFIFEYADGKQAAGYEGADHIAIGDIRLQSATVYVANDLAGFFEQPCDGELITIKNWLWYTRTKYLKHIRIYHSNIL